MQIAKASGIYRCTGLGQTKYCEVGESLPAHECEEGHSCTWELLKKDNMRSEDAIPVFIGRGIFHVIETDELPEVGARYNIRGAMGAGLGLETGEHEVLSVEDNFRWEGKSYIRIQVVWVGELSKKLPIHQTHVMNC